MTTLIVYAQDTDGYLDSDGSAATAQATWDECRSGTGSLSANTTADTLYLWESTDWSGSLSASLYQAFMRFDTSALAGQSVQNVTFTTYSIIGNDTFDIELRAYDWGTGLTTADWIPGADWSSKPLCATRTTLLYGSINWTTADGFRSAINLAGYTGLVSSGALMGQETAPATEIYRDLGWRSANYSGTTYDPKLTIEYGPALTATFLGCNF